MPNVWFNGHLIDEDDARVSIRDFGLLHAAGVFTTMRATAAGVIRIGDHLARLRNSCDALGIPLPYADEELADAATDLLRDEKLVDARLRLTVTRGEQQTLPTQEVGLKPNVFLTATAFEPYPKALYDAGMTVLAYEDLKLNPYDLQAGHKTLNYLSRFAALREATRRGANETLLFNVHNYLQSGAISNVFVVRGGTVLTPPTNEELRDEAVRKTTPYSKSNVLPGIARLAVLEAAALDSIKVERRALSVNDVLEADEVFLTNSVMGVMPVCRVERKAIGNEKPGPITTRLAATITQESQPR